MDVIKTLNKLPQLKTAVLLIIGAQGVGKHALGRAIVDNSGTVCIQCRTATGLPLPAGSSASRPRIDFITLLVNLTNKNSFSEVEGTLMHLDKNYFVGRMCVVATQNHMKDEQCVEVESLTQLTDSYNCPLLWTDIDDDADRVEVAKKLIHLVSTSAGLKAGVTSLLVESTRDHYATDIL